MNKVFKIAIIGGGAAGLMAALSASEITSEIVLIEKNQILGRKILATGNGRCNLTNRNVSEKNYFGGDTRIISSILRQFDQDQTIDFFQNQLGILLKEEDRGRIFPRTNQASTIVDRLTEELKVKKIEVMLGQTVKNVTKSQTWKINLLSGETIQAEKLIICTGGKASHQLGSSGDGMYFATTLGHSVIPSYSALAPIETKETWPREVSGLRLDQGSITSYANGEVIFNSKGDVLFTHFGVSGPAVLAQARQIAPFLAQNQKVTLSIDIFDDKSESQLEEVLIQSFAPNGKKAVKNTLGGLVPKNLCEIVLRLASIDPEKKSAEISKIERKKLVQTLKSLTLAVSQTRPLKEAQVSTGGIETKEINPRTLESKIVPDLYFAGEVLDFDGESGGFNLQWAWSSGFVAGKYAAESLDNK